MHNDINLTSVFCTDIIGILLSFLMLVSSKWRLRDHSNESKYVVGMILSVLISCIMDLLLFVYDGTPGDAAGVFLILGNTWLYFADILIGSFWVLFLLHRLYGDVPKLYLYIIIGVMVMSLVLLLANFVYPIVFKLNEYNQYVRLSCSYVFFSIFVFYLVECIAAYYYVQHESGDLKFFPIWALVIPVIIGLVVQIKWYGVSMVWPCAAVGLAGVIMSLQNIQMFQDKLTGIYNRSFLENLQNTTEFDSNSKYCVLMLDLNGFKGINDIYGHSVGDKALIDFASILRRAAGSKGIAIRYAGDEFVIIIKTEDVQDGYKCVDKINRMLDEFNASKKVPYTLSAAIGCGMSDMNSENIEAIIKKVDKEMYKNKEEYYKEHGKR